jgi:hypothetical protein
MKTAFKRGLIILGCGAAMSCGVAIAADITQIQVLAQDGKPSATRAREAAVIATTKGRVSRAGDDLILTLKGKEPLTLTTYRTCAGMAATDTSCIDYVLVADLPERGVYLLQKVFYTRTDYALIDAATGRATTLSVFPQFSADGTRFIVAGFDHADDGDVNALEIWRREKDGAVLEWELPYGDTTLGYVARARLIKWEGDTVNMEFETADAAEGKPAPMWRGSIKKVGTSWKLSKD